MRFFLNLYDFFCSHRRWLWALLAVLLIVLGTLAASLRYREDITDFLPVDDEYRESAAICQELSEASRIVVIFEGNSPDSLCDAIDAYAARLEECSSTDTVLSPERLITSLDVEGYLARLRFVHSHAPFFLTDSDYTRLDTLLTPSAIAAAVQRDRTILSMPGSGIMKSAIASDPLALFPLSMGASGQYAGATQAFTSYAGYMMTSDQRMAFAFYDTPFGSTESSRNAVLCDALLSLSEETMVAYPGVNVRLLGAPVVAVGNARRIKLDSLLAIGLSLLLIVALLWYAFPRKRDILLILFAVGFGWLFGMAALRLVAVRVSVIVLGIGSIIVGIAVNYPLHLLVHQRYTASVRQTLEEVLSPLVVGNITTVGAFLALIPLKATALRDLGIFAAAMLLGTILFCILFLPHLMSAAPTPVREIHLLPRRLRNTHSPLAASAALTSPLAGANSSLNTSPLAGAHSSLLTQHSTLLTGLSLLALTLLAAVLPPFVRHDWRLFDSNMSHINYMTPQQRADFAFFESLSGQSDQPAYLASSAREELSRRADLWTAFWSRHDVDSVITSLQSASLSAGFREEAFAPFVLMLRIYVPQNGIGLSSSSAPATVTADSPAVLSEKSPATVTADSPAVLSEKSPQSEITGGAATAAGDTREGESFSANRHSRSANCHSRSTNRHSPGSSFGENSSDREFLAKRRVSPLTPDAIAKLSETELASLWPGRFDSAALNSRVASSLSDNFDYLGTVCSLIVFLFLWLSFATETENRPYKGRSFEESRILPPVAQKSLRGLILALIAFLPMIVSWIWIIAIMRIAGLQFNIVNVILATFIFGQGDDYTIFILEGLLYEDRTGKRMLPQYRQSIILSALIMLIGIGVLVVAAHPAMHSLGIVTLIGMSCVVLMAWLVPPVLFRLVLRIPGLPDIIRNN